jgi:hypothetical protein
MTMIGIYGCDADPTITTPGSKCYKITSIAAPAEWILALCFINYLMAMSYVLWNAASIRMDMTRRELQRRSESMLELQTPESQNLYSVRVETMKEVDHWWKRVFSLTAIKRRWGVKRQLPYEHLDQG